MFCFNFSRYSSTNDQPYLWYCKYWNYGKVLAPNRGTSSQRKSTILATLFIGLGRMKTEAKVVPQNIGGVL